jgi:hypothetical protein
VVGFDQVVVVVVGMRGRTVADGRCCCWEYRLSWVEVRDEGADRDALASAVLRGAFMV